MRFKYKGGSLFWRILSLILVCSFAFSMVVACEEKPKEKFPPDDGGNEIYVPVDNNNSSNNNSSNNNSSNNNSSNNNSSTYKKRVAITYDDGPHNVYTGKIVDELAKYGYNATFFVVGNRVDGEAYNGAKSVKYAASKGNEIAIHAYTHNVYYTDDADNATKYKAEMTKTYQAIKSVVPSASVRLMRPTGGHITDKGISTCPYAVIQWGVDSNDWKYKSEGAKNVETIVNNVMSSVKNGSIILMHDIYENTYLATVQILKQLYAQGYDVVTVSELLGNPRAGVEYYSAS